MFCRTVSKIGVGIWLTIAVDDVRRALFDASVASSQKSDLDGAKCRGKGE
jgi:hypothetical protein